MDPNTQHQIWFKWTATITRPMIQAHLQRWHQGLVQTEWATFLKKMAGSVGAARVTHRISDVGSPGKPKSIWTLEGLIEGTPLHDPGKEAEGVKLITEWARRGFGASADIAVECVYRAGDLQDGKAPEQLLIVPHIDTTAAVHGPG